MRPHKPKSVGWRPEEMRRQHTHTPTRKHTVAWYCWLSLPLAMMDGNHRLRLVRLDGMGGCGYAIRALYGCLLLSLALPAQI